MITDNVLIQLEIPKILDYIARYAITEKGKERIKSIKPYETSELAIEQGALVSEAKEIIIEKDTPPISYIPILEKIIYKSRIANAVLTVDEIKEILNLAEVSRKTYSFFNSVEKSGNIFDKYASRLFVDRNFENHLSKVFTPSGEISDNASVQLRKIRNEIHEKSANLRSIVGRILKKLSQSYLVQEEYTTQRDGRIVLPVKVEHKRHVRGFIHSESATGQTVYIEPEETLELNNEILSLKFAEKREIERILYGLTKKIGDVSGRLIESYEIISFIDELFAKAKYSTEIIGGFPSIDDTLPVRLLNARHPVLLKKMGRNNTVPLTIEIDKEKVIILTGPNAGGKTVVLKNFAVQNIMAACGIHIPADPDSNLHFYSSVLLDIGDKQSIEDDLSTFSSHLNNINNILNEADEKTLILLDEIGTGTDPEEGSALAAAILEELKDIGATVLASTHHGNLKILANEMEGFQNASMEFDVKNLEPTYRFRQGLPGSSYAFEVASRIGLSERIIKKASEYIDSGKRKLEEFLVDIERKSYLLNSRLRELEIENTRLKGLSDLYQKRITELEKQKKEILKETKSKAENYLRNLNKEFEATIKNIKESNASREVIKEEKKRIEQIKKMEEIAVEEEPEIIPGEIKVGDYVILRNSSTGGEIIEIDNAKSRASILSGSLKIQVKLKDLVKAKRPKKGKQSFYDTNKLISNIAGTRLDIRGRKPEEVEYEVIKFLDEAYASNLNRVEILHGKGTGALKETVRQILKKNDYVNNYYYANIEAGGEGITIVEFK